MAETRFIKTAAFGGYCKADVDKRLDYLYSQVYELKNELRETKLTLDEYKKGTDEEKAHETILAAERAKLTSEQVQNETLSQKLREMREDNKEKENQINSLNKNIEELKNSLKDANEKLANFQAENDAAALSNVFIEAQKAANMLIEEANKKAEKISQDSKKMVENMVTEANNKAAKIVYEAEKNAAKINAQSRTDIEQMKVSSENLKAAMLNDIEGIDTEISKIRELFEALEKSGLDKLEKTHKLLKKTENKLCSGGIPVFKEPKVIEPKLPEVPDYKQVDYNYSSNDAQDKKKKNDDLEKLMAMANAIEGADSNSSKKSDADPKKNNNKKVNLSELAKQADALSGKESENIDLEALLKQAESLGNNS